MKNIIIFGPPGSGKGTQGLRLAKKYALTHISTGDVIRGEISKGSAQGQEAKALIDDGQLISDELMLCMLKEQLEQISGGVVLDGFPRTVSQAVACEELLHKQGLGGLIFLELKVSENEIIKRLLKRGETSGRSDDHMGIIKKRIAVYEKNTAPVSGYYKEMKEYQSVEGIGSIDDIFERICALLENTVG